MTAKKKKKKKAQIDDLLDDDTTETDATVDPWTSSERDYTYEEVCFFISTKFLFIV